MERRDFFKSAGIASVCTCFVARALAGEPGASTPPTPPPEDWRVEFAKQRYSNLVTMVAAKVDANGFRHLMEQQGAFCSGSGFSGKFPGQLEAYLQEMQKRWGAETSYDKTTRTVQVAFAQPNGDCACPLMSKTLVPGAACYCSVGAMKRSFATVTGQEVAVALKESALQGGKRCAFTIQL